MKRIAKIFGIILLVAAGSLVMALGGILIGSGSVSAILGHSQAESLSDKEASAAADTGSDDKPDTAGTESSSESSSNGINAPETEKETIPSFYYPEKQELEGIIMVGDSRTIGMQKAMAGRPDMFLYIGESGEGYSWLTDYALEQMDSAIKAHPDWPVVLNLGVNDTQLVMDYITLYQSFAGRYPDTRFFYLSVNPLTDESVNVTDEEVVVFNRYLKMAFPETYLDSYSMLKKEGFESADGVHYSDDTYRRIHEFIMEELEERF